MTDLSTLPSSPAGLGRLSEEELDQFGEELDAIRQRVLADLGEEDRQYIERMVRTQRGLEVAGRGLMFAGLFPPAWLAGVACLSLSKIIDNMEIGHNVMHGQYDWMREPALTSRKFEWDTVSPSEHWRRSHNYMHHTFTNIVGKDRDVGYGILRMDERQRWNPYYLGNPVYAFLLMVFFQWGVWLHELEVERLVSGEVKWSDTAEIRQQMRKKATSQVLKDYVLFPALTGPMAPLTLVGNATANLVRNIWSFSIIFCGHFPEGAATFTEEETANETRGGWYLRQMLGSSNITGGRLFHILSGNLSHQIEHHLFPDIPAWRYSQIAPEIRAICERYGLPYNTGSFSQQIGSVAKKIVSLSLPNNLSRLWLPWRRRPAAPVVNTQTAGSVDRVQPLVAA